MVRPGDTHPEQEPSGPISAFGEAHRPTDGERYRWIADNRNSAALHDALRNASASHDFDDLIDAAMRAQREGQDAQRLARPAKPFGRRRSDFE